MTDRESVYQKALAATLVRLRTEMGLSQDELAARSGFCRQHISMIECGRRNPTFYSIFQLCEGLGIDEMILLITLRQYLPREVKDNRYFAPLPKSWMAAEAPKRPKRKMASSKS